jgi:hypothetical protein
VARMDRSKYRMPETCSNPDPLKRAPIASSSRNTVASLRTPCSANLASN